MDRLTKNIDGYIYGAEGVSVENLTGGYCRGEYEATAVTERLFQYEVLVEQFQAKLKQSHELRDNSAISKDELHRINMNITYACSEFIDEMLRINCMDLSGQYNLSLNKNMT